MAGSKDKDRPLYKNYDMWAAGFLVIHALAILFIQSPAFNGKSMYQARIPYSLMTHLPFRINPEYPHPMYKNKTHLARRAWCNPLFQHAAITAGLKGAEAKLKLKFGKKAPKLFPIQSKQRLKNKAFLGLAPVKGMIKGYRVDSKSWQDVSMSYLWLGFRKQSICQMMPQEGNSEGACWGAPHLGICLIKYPKGVAMKGLQVAKAKNVTSDIKKATKALQWTVQAVKKYEQFYNPITDFLDVTKFPENNISCGYPDFCQIFGLGTEFRKVGLLGVAYAWLYLIGLIPVFLTLFDPPPAVPHKLERISHQIARFYPVFAASLLTAAFVCGAFWIKKADDILQRDVNTAAMRKAYPYVDENNPGFLYDVGHGMSMTMYNLVPTALNALVYWVLIFTGVKYPRFPSKILERRRRFEEGYKRIKSQIEGLGSDFSG